MAKYGLYSSSERRFLSGNTYTSFSEAKKEAAAVNHKFGGSWYPRVWFAVKAKKMLTGTYLPGTVFKKAPFKAGYLAKYKARKGYGGYATARSGGAAPGWLNAWHVRNNQNVARAKMMSW